MSDAPSVDLDRAFDVQHFSMRQQQIMELAWKIYTSRLAHDESGYYGGNEPIIALSAINDAKKFAEAWNAELADGRIASRRS